MTNEEAAVTIVRKARAWDSLMSVLEAYAEPELSGVTSGAEALDGFIAVYQRQKAERATLEAENARLAALVEWYGLLARSANLGKAEWGEAEGGWMQVGGLDNDPIRPVEFRDGLPVEREDIKAALPAALGEKPKP